MTSASPTGHRPRIGQKRGLSLREYAAILCRYRATFVAVAALAFVFLIAWILSTPTKYVSRTQLLVSISGSTTAAAYENDGVVTGRVNSYVALLTSDAVSQRVIDTLGLPVTAPELAAKVSATRVPPNTSLIDVAVTADSAQQAQQIAGAYAKEFIAYTAALETPTGEDGQKVHVTPVTSATLPSSHLGRRVVLSVLAAATALLLAVVAAWIRWLMDPFVRNADRATAATGVPVIASVTDVPAKSADELEAYRRLRTALGSHRWEERHVIVMASPDGGTDLPVVAANLGRTAVAADRRCVVISTRPSGEDATAIELDAAEPAPGADGGPDSLTLASWAADPDIIPTRASADLLRRLRTDYDLIIIAGPPVNSNVSSSALSDYADAVVLAVSADGTRRADATEAARRLSEVGAPVIGVVLIRAPENPDLENRDPEMGPDSENPDPEKDTDSENPDPEKVTDSGNDPDSENPDPEKVTDSGNDPDSENPDPERDPDSGKDDMAHDGSVEEAAAPAIDRPTHTEAKGV
jgi:capsular polysaccharide biosynthesis protein